MPSKILTRHHIIAKANPLRGANESDNIKMLEMNIHRNLHNLFALKTPVEQLQIVIEIAKTALAPGFHRDLTDVIGDYRGQSYKPWVCLNDESSVLTPNRFSHNPPPPHGKSYD